MERWKGEIVRGKKETDTNSFSCIDDGVFVDRNDTGGGFSGHS